MNISHSLWWNVTSWNLLPYLGILMVVRLLNSLGQELSLGLYATFTWLCIRKPIADCYSLGSISNSQLRTWVKAGVRCASFMGDTSDRLWSNAVLMLGHRLRRWTNIETALSQRLVLTGMVGWCVSSLCVVVHRLHGVISIILSEFIQWWGDVGDI